MCCCNSPNVNGTPGYRWNATDATGVRPINAPTVGPLDGEIRFDEPGRCGGQDSHCHHYRVVGTTFPKLLVRHGGGDEAIRLSNGKQVVAALAALDSTGRYWLLNALYHAQADARRAGSDAATTMWRKAAAEHRIKVRKVRNSSSVRVEMISAPENV